MPTKKTDNQTPSGFAQEIMAQVYEVCCFGSINQGKVTQLRESFFELWKIISTARENTKLLSNIQQTSEKRLSKHIDLLKTTGIQAPFIFDSKHIKRGSLVYYFPLEVLAQRSTLELAKKLDKTFHWPQALPRNLYALFGMYFKHYNITESILEIRKGTHKDPAGFNKIMENEQRYAKLIDDQKPIINSQDRIFFFEQTMHYARTISYQYGWGNCSHMADLALLFAVNREVPFPITYLHFTSSQHEELYALALGDWPNQNCTILDNWRKRLIQWEGSLNKTSALSHYQKVTAILSLTTNKQGLMERALFKEKLKKEQFLEWIINRERKKTTNAIIRCCHSSGMINELSASVIEAISGHLSITTQFKYREAAKIMDCIDDYYNFEEAEKDKKQHAPG